MTVAIIISLLLLGEAALQLRNYLKTGRSAMALVAGTTTVVMNDKFGIRTYKPNFTLTSQDPGYKFITNSSGFRSPEIPPVRAPEETRIVVVGASTVAGLYSRTNELTFPGLLETGLRQQMPGRLINVVNAGIEGYRIRDVEQMVDKAVIPQRPSTVLIYPGFNDMGAICGAARSIGGSRPKPLPAPALPHWVMSQQLISKNTMFLREPPMRTGIIDPAKFFPAEFGETLDRMVTKLVKAGIAPVLITTARSYKGAPAAEAAKLAESSLFFHSCMDLAGLNRASEMFNRVVAQVAQRHGVGLVDLASIMPYGRQYFVDANHFTLKGDKRAQEVLQSALRDIQH